MRGLRTAILPVPAAAVILIALLGGCGGGAPAERGGRTGQAAPARAEDPVETWFTDITDASGIDFILAGSGGTKLHMPEIMAGGIGLFDGDGDGDLDLYLVDVNEHLPNMEVSTTRRNRYYRQEADGRFVDATDESGLGDGGYGMGVAAADVDNDGDVDVFVTNYGSSRLYRGRGDGTFAMDESAALVDGWATSAAFVDYDADGWLDLYVCRYLEYNPNKTCRAPSGVVDYCGPKEFLPTPDVLLRNRGDGTFEDVSTASGIAGVAAAGLGVVCADFDEDGRTDIFVANDAYANNLWRNRGDGTFEDHAVLAGAALNNMGVEEAGMGVVAADFDADGRLDLFLTHLGRETNTLYRNEGRGVFTDATASTGVGQPSVQYTGFGTVAFDADLDGAIDLFVGNGRVSSDPVLDGAVPGPPWNRYAEPNLFFRNQGNGSFEVLGPEVAALCAPIEITRGVATGDLDDDGDLDLVMMNLEGKARIYRNDAPRRGHWLAVRVADPALGRDAVGAEVCVLTGGRRLVRITGGGFSYLSTSAPDAHFGLAPGATIEAIEVRYGDGRTETFPAPEIDRAVVLRRGEGRMEPE